MKRTMKSIIGAVFAFGLLVFAPQLHTFAADGTYDILLRVEGINETFYYNTVEITDADELTAQELLLYADAQEDSLTMTGVDTAYITDVNGDMAGTFGGWDGWLYTVNGVAAATGIDGCVLQDGDSVVLYYGDPYGVGMQFPVVDATASAEGILTFTSEDTTYDANYNAVVTVNPVAGADVTLSDGTTSLAYITDENGQIMFDQNAFAGGTYSISISKTSEQGIPLVLRTAADATVTIDTAVTAVTEETSQTIDAVPQTNDEVPGLLYFAVGLLIFAVIGIAALIVYKVTNKKDNGK